MTSTSFRKKNVVLRVVYYYVSNESLCFHRNRVGNFFKLKLVIFSTSLDLCTNVATTMLNMKAYAFIVSE